MVVQGEIADYAQFLSNNLHILVEEPDAIWQLALNQVDSSVIFKEARTCKHILIYLVLT